MFFYAISSLKIVNGTDAEEHEFPYMVQLRSLMGFFTCGGGILSPEWIITAGHCVDGVYIASVIYGTNKLHDFGGGLPNTTIKVKNWYQHPNFTYSSHLPIYDVAILQLTEPIPFGQNAQPIKLAEADQEVPFHVEGVLSGWGVTETYGDSPPNLQKIYLKLLNDEECTKKINDYSKRDSFVPAHHLCSDDYYNGECLTFFSYGFLVYPPIDLSLVLQIIQGCLQYIELPLQNLDVL